MSIEKSLQKRLDDAIDRALGERRIIGVVTLVSLDGEPVYRRAAGYLDREDARPMVEDAIFRLASVTKPIVATGFLLRRLRAIMASTMSECQGEESANLVGGKIAIVGNVIDA